MMFYQVLVTEFMKLRHSKVPWATLGALSMGPLGIAQASGDAARGGAGT